MWWIGPAGEVDDAGPGTDFNAVRRGFVSVTPIHVDLTRFQALDKVSSWMKTLSDGMADHRSKGEAA
jgi:5'-nucleotidase